MTRKRKKDDQSYKEASRGEASKWKLKVGDSNKPYEAPKMMSDDDPLGLWQSMAFPTQFPLQRS